MGMQTGESEGKGPTLEQNVCGQRSDHLCVSPTPRRWVRATRRAVYRLQTQAEWMRTAGSGQARAGQGRAPG